MKRRRRYSRHKCRDCNMNADTFRSACFSLRAQRLGEKIKNFPFWQSGNGTRIKADLRGLTRIFFVARAETSLTVTSVPPQSNPSMLSSCSSRQKTAFDRMNRINRKPFSTRSAPRQEIKKSTYSTECQWNTDKSGFARIDTDFFLFRPFGSRLTGSTGLPAVSCGSFHGT